MRKIGMAQIKNVLKIIKSKLGRFGQWLDEVYNPWMLKIQPYQSIGLHPRRSPRQEVDPTSSRRNRALQD